MTAIAATLTSVLGHYARDVQAFFSWEPVQSPFTFARGIFTYLSPLSRSTMKSLVGLLQQISSVPPKQGLHYATKIRPDQALLLRLAMRCYTGKH